MGKVIFCLLLLSPALTLEAKSFEKYMYFSNKAELLIAQERYQEAVMQYDSAFACWEKPFAADYRNALQCAVTVDNMEKGYRYARALMLLGCDIDFFRKQARLKKFRASKAWRQLIDEYTKLRQAYLERCNWQLRSKLEQLRGRDQYWRNQDPTYTICPDSTYKEDKEIMKDLLSSLRDGYPTVWEIGVFISRDTVLESDPISILLLHNYVSDETYKEGPDLTVQLLGYVKSGQMHPEVFASLNDRSGEYRVMEGYGYESFVYLIKGKYYTEKRSAAQINSMEELRREIWLDSLEEMKEKFVFQNCLNKGQFDFFQGNILSVVDIPIPLLQQFFEEVEECR